jgi:hypothetical protein
MTTEKSEATEDYLRNASDLEFQLNKSNKKMEEMEKKIKLSVSENKDEVVILKVTQTYNQ